MMLAALRDAIQHPVGTHRPVKMARHGRPFEISQVPAFKEPNEVSR